jgi:hypothetical protein
MQDEERTEKFNTTNGTSTTFILSRLYLVKEIQPQINKIQQQRREDIHTIKTSALYKLKWISVVHSGLSCLSSCPQRWMQRVDLSMLCLCCKTSHQAPHSFAVFSSSCSSRTQKKITGVSWPTSNDRQILWAGSAVYTT